MNTVKQIILHACVDADITVTEVARQFGISRVQFYKRMDTGKFSLQEWQLLNEIIPGGYIAKYLMQCFYAVEEV